eukprot:2013110-Rhodomonas_salina.2
MRTRRREDNSHSKDEWKDLSLMVMHVRNGVGHRIDERLDQSMLQEHFSGIFDLCQQSRCVTGRPGANLLTSNNLQNTTVEDKRLRPLAFANPDMMWDDNWGIMMIP